MMKKLFHSKYIFTLILLFACSVMQADNKGLRIYGELEGIKDTLIVDIVNPLETKAIKVTKFVLEDNKFDVIVPIDGAAMLFIYEKGNMAMNHFNVVAVPGEELQLTGCMPKCETKGSPFYLRYFEIEKSIKNRETNPYDYVKSHLDNDLSGMVFGFLNKEQAYELHPLLSERLKQGRMGNYINVVVSSFRRMDRIAKGKKTCAVGTEAPNFALTDIQGKAFHLSSLRGKFVILDFWGSWCGSCIGGFPKMKEYYNKYQGKYEVLGVDCKDTELRWKAAVKKYQLPWLHVQVKKTDPDISEMYGVEGYPTQILIDPEGKIIYREMGSEEAFYEKLDELFGE